MCGYCNVVAKVFCAAYWPKTKEPIYKFRCSPAWVYDFFFYYDFYYCPPKNKYINKINISLYQSLDSSLITYKSNSSDSGQIRETIRAIVKVMMGDVSAAISTFCSF